MCPYRGNVTLGEEAEFNSSLDQGSIIFKIRVFYKARFEGFEFFIRWPYAVFHKMQVVFHKKCAFLCNSNIYEG